MLTHERLREVLHYEPSTGVFTWRVRINTRAPAGSVAGYTRKDGYKAVRLDGVKHLAHRLAWLYAHGEWPHALVDHIDGNPSNNALGNLRACTQVGNMRNARTRSSNTSGVKGVYYCPRDNRWIARVETRVDGKRVLRQRYCKTLDDAARVVRDLREALHGEYARHG